MNCLGLKLDFNKSSTLRDVCMCLGVIIERKNYDIFDRE
jgi:hypothetical protein